LEAAVSDDRSVISRSPIRFNNGRTLPLDPDAPLKHVIDQYQHRQQVVTCVCGWHGSTAAAPGERSAWDDHKALYRVGRR
jgi:hypothetical protein